MFSISRGENKMNSDRFSNRIDEIEEIGILSDLVCKEYNLGDYIDTNIIEIGYEDFNAIITASSGKYFMKVFRNSRDDAEVRNVIERAYVAEQNNVNSPKIYKNSNNDIITNINYGNSRFRLAMMEYIEGSNFFELGRKATINELKQIADLGSSLNKIEYQPNFIYDSWAITSFTEEFESKKQYISEEHLKLIQPIYDKFKGFDYSSLPKSFVHGDITQINLMKDKNQKFWIVDFSVANYIARLTEIIIICNNFAVIPGNKQESEERIKIAFEQWAKGVNATNLERKSFQMLYDVANAIYLVNPSYEIAMENDSEENRMFFELGKFGLSLDVDMNKEKELNER